MVSYPISERPNMHRPEAELREMKRPRCKACGANTMLVRRTPDPDHGARHELRTFICHKCKRERTVSIVLTESTTKPLGGRHRSLQRN
jgi:transposase-like protein